MILHKKSKDIDLGNNLSQLNKPIMRDGVFCIDQLLKRLSKLTAIYEISSSLAFDVSNCIDSTGLV